VGVGDGPGVGVRVSVRVGVEVGVIVGVLVAHVPIEAVAISTILVAPKRSDPAITINLLPMAVPVVLECATFMLGPAIQVSVTVLYAQVESYGPLGSLPPNTYMVFPIVPAPGW
jgi:hypothetical protein